MTDHAAEIRNPASPDDCARPNPTCESARTAAAAHHPREAPDRSEASRGRVLAGTPARLPPSAAILLEFSASVRMAGAAPAQSHEAASATDQSARPGANHRRTFDASMLFLIAHFCSLCPRLLFRPGSRMDQRSCPAICNPDTDEAQYVSLTHGGFRAGSLEQLDQGEM